MGRSQYILHRESSALLVIDMQEKILPVILESERVVENTLKLINGFKILSVPIYFTEQYPKGLGPTESKIKTALDNTEAIHKMTFSCSGAGDLFEELKGKRIKQIVVCGIESHVCVIQTVLDLLSEGFQVHVAADAVSSRRKFDYEIAIRRMESNGAEITLTESVLFELLNICGTDEFKAISKLVK
ncbi:MAG: hydrolase [Ignavibacteriales bacterium]|nr:hydrolase [Ignavibacteriales bacterium]